MRASPGPSSGGIATERLEIVPASPGLVRDALDGPRAPGASLRASVPPTWPPDYLDAPSLRLTLERLADGAGQAGWWLHFVVLKGGGGGTLIGSGGYKGPPSADGTVEVGYSIVVDHRRRGYASEAVHGLLARAESRRVAGRRPPVS